MKEIKINPESEYNGDNHRARINQNTFVCKLLLSCKMFSCPLSHYNLCVAGSREHYSLYQNVREMGVLKDQEFF